ncbi:GTPase IMAP family member 4-like [Pecten maximus]|uniref:GTPase IMAP family member 4-like n=1 Tax=Pecten maximus TaxID=6579 RepID=UPI0014591BA0|nr:GTPase IMAP family member 4-like [Pecten maximus]
MDPFWARHLGHQGIICFCIVGGTSKSELRVLVVGETGCGKSVTGNALLGADLFTTGAEAKAYPKDKCFRGESDKFKGWEKVVVVDTPGKFFRISDQDEKMKKGEITKIAGIMSPGPHVIILVLTKVKTDNRVRKNEEKIAQFYTKSFGKNIENHFVFLFAGEDDDATAKATVPKDNYLYRLMRDTPRNYLAFNATAAGKDKNTEKLHRIVSGVVDENNGNFHTDKTFKDVQMKNEERAQELKGQEDNLYRHDIEKLKKDQKQKMDELIRRYDRWIKEAEMAHKKKLHPDSLTSQVRDEYQNETGIWYTIADVTIYLWEVFSPYVKKFFKK